MTCPWSCGYRTASLSSITAGSSRKGLRHSSRAIPTSFVPIWVKERNVLELRDVVCCYGPVTALRGISLTVGKGQLVDLIGANGAGKTTTLKAISGLLHAR